MVLAFSANYDKNTRTQNDVILMERDGKFVLQERINLQPQAELEFEKEDDAYKAFDKVDSE